MGSGGSKPTRGTDKSPGSEAFRQSVGQAIVRISRERTEEKLKLDRTAVDKFLTGDVSIEVPPKNRIVRIFTSSTFTDTMHERNTWMQRAYPELRAFCQMRGYEFQVVDMRWGVRDEASDDHTTLDLCMSELRQCQKLSTGPNFISLLANKYGYRAPPRTIRVDQFLTLIGVVENDHHRSLLNKWYLRDDNAVPPEYVLQPKSRILPNHKSKDKELLKVAYDQSTEEIVIIKTTLEQAARTSLSEDEAEEYYVSITEKEVQAGLLDVTEPEKHCLWFWRRISDIEHLKNQQQDVLRKFIDTDGDQEYWRESRRLLGVLEDTKMKPRLPKKNLYQYPVKWTKDGINPENNNHKAYLKQMTDTFILQMERLIEEGIEQRSETELTNPLMIECCQHVRFCQQKCENFCGRETTLSKIEAYIKSTSTKPLVIHGASGCGKTSLMAMTARLVPSWLSNTKPAVILRFIGTTPDSSNISGILISIIKQIKSIYNQTSQMPESLQELSNESEFILKFATQSQPLVIILDTLDQIDVSYNARSLFWLPRTLPEHVKLIVSTLEDAEFECFPKLKVMFKEEQFVSVPELTSSEAETIIQQWLRSRRRTLNPTQMTLLNQCVLQCPLPLFLKLSFESAHKWHSYWEESETILQQTVQTSINYLFSKLESKHGQIFVSRTLGYLTASRSGLSETELEDVLSCDDDVLNDVYQYWEPPVRRLPPLLLVRLKTDLQQYIVERGSDGISIFNWYHRQFKETAGDRYCVPQVAEQIHAGLADFFNGKWSEERKKPYVGKNRRGEEDRHVSSQPLVHGSSYNLRRLNNAPYHMIMQGNVSELKTECLMKFEFLHAKVVATSVRQILDDFAFARKTFPHDQDLTIVGAALEMSQSALLYDPLQLAPQLMDRLSGEENTTDLLRQCEQCNVPYIAPDQEVLIKPGGQLIYCLTGHQGPVNSVDIREDGKLAVSCSNDDENSVKTWNLIEGKLQKSYDGINKNPTRVRFVCSGKNILVDYEDSYTVIRESGEIVFTRNDNIGGQSAIGGKEKTLLALFCDVTVQVYNLENDELVAAFEISDSSTKLFCFNMPTYIAASENYAVLTDSDQHYVTVFSFADRTVSKWCQVFNPERKTGQPDLTIDAIVISPDEKRFILSNIRDNDLHIFDIVSRQKLAFIKGFQSDFAQKYRMTACGNLLYFPGDVGVIVWNLLKEQRSCILAHPGALCDAVCWSWKTMVTATDDDSTVRVWDLEKEEKENNNQSRILGHKIRHFLPLQNTRYVVVLAQTHRTNDSSCCLQVYDVQTKTVVRQSSLNTPPGVIKVLDDKRIAVVTSTRKIKIINLDSMTVDKVFDGDLSGYTLDLHVKCDGTEIITHTRGRQQFKRYDTKTGKTKAIIQRPAFIKKDSTNPFEETFYVNKKWTVLAARLLDGPWLLFDIKSLQCISSISLEYSYNGIPVEKAALSDDGQLFMFGANSKIQRPGISKKGEDDPASFIIWDIGKSTLVAQCDDAEYQAHYSEILNRKGLDVSVDKMHMIDATRLLTVHDDFILRVWDSKSGELISRLVGHNNSVIHVCAKEQGPYFFSYEVENAIRVWEKSTLRCLASFRLDNLIVAFRMCEDSKQIITSTTSPAARLVHWRVKEGDNSISEVPSPELFKGTVTEGKLDLLTAADNLYTDKDLDTDEDIDYEDSGCN